MLIAFQSPSPLFCPAPEAGWTGSFSLALSKGRHQREVRGCRERGGGRKRDKEGSGQSNDSKQLRIRVRIRLEYGGLIQDLTDGIITQDHEIGHCSVENSHQSGTWRTQGPFGYSMGREGNEGMSY